MDESVELILARMLVNALGQHAINGGNGSESNTRQCASEHLPLPCLCTSSIGAVAAKCHADAESKSSENWRPMNCNSSCGLMDEAPPPKEEIAGSSLASSRGKRPLGPHATELVRASFVHTWNLMHKAHPSYE